MMLDVRTSHAEELLMRHELAVTLVSCGTLLALAPALYDYSAGRAQIATVAEIAQTVADAQGRVTVPSYPQLGGEYRFGCWLLGAAAIAVGMIGGWSQASCHPAEDGRC